MTALWLSWQREPGPLRLGVLIPHHAFRGEGRGTTRGGRDARAPNRRSRLRGYIFYGDGALHQVMAPNGYAQKTFTYHPTGLMNTATIGARTITNTWDAKEHRVRVTTWGLVSGGFVEEDDDAAFWCACDKPS